MEAITPDLRFQRWTEVKETEMRGKALQTKKAAPPKKGMEGRQSNSKWTCKAGVWLSTWIEKWARA